MDGEWSEWIEHDGKGCPVWGRPVQVVNEGWPGVWSGIAGSAGGRSWFWEECRARVLRYRYRKPAGLLLLERIAADPLDMVPA
jgi:hypothetical protein